MTSSNRSPLAAILVIATLIPGCQHRAEPGNDGMEQRIELTALEDKIRGGWAGQMIGVTFGAPTEFQYLGRLVPAEEVPPWSPERIREALDQDDLYVDITLAEVLDRHGLDATTEDFAASFRDSEYSLWHANLAARRALRRGVPPTESGTPQYNVHANDIDFQIEADFIGLMSPGMPRTSNEFCRRVGRIMNHGDGLYGGMFISAMYSAAFFEDDPRRLVEAGLAALPSESPYARVIADVLTWSEMHPDDWIRVWHLIDEKWNGREPCSQGALDPFNIDAKINGAYVALGLLYGRGDFERTMTIATRAGQDSDCNPASAAGVLGVVLGYDGIPAEFTRGLADIVDDTFSYTESSFRSVVDSTLRRAIALAEKEGGRREGDSLVVRSQQPEAALPDLWDDYGSPAERLSIDDPRWTWRGEWAETRVHKWGRDFSSRASDKSGTDVSISFRGTGAILIGWYLPTGGVADVFLDDEPAGRIDVHPDEEDVKFDEAVWHAFDLANADHELRLVVRGEPYRDSGGLESRGADIALTGLVVFRP